METKDNTQSDDASAQHNSASSFYETEAPSESEEEDYTIYNHDGRRRSELTNPDTEESSASKYDHDKSPEEEESDSQFSSSISRYIHENPRTPTDRKLPAYDDSE